MNTTPSQLDDSVAIVGMACRFPGAPDLEAFWRLLVEGREALTRFSDAELLASGVARRWLEDPRYVRAGMILDDIESFDAGFFGLGPREVEIMDPQQRLLLECAWHALEDAGHPPGNGDRVGVYVGARLSEYMLFHLAPPDLFGHRDQAPLEGFQRLLGNDKDYLATRLAYLLDLRGPAITVQTACSTSLVAVHLACQSLLNGECDLALAGGASVRVPQKAGYLYSEGMIFSPDGRTRPFDAAANGTLFSSGVGIVALRRLADAMADGDTIAAIIRGSAVNNDGAGPKSAFTAPGHDGQVRVVTEALAVAGVDPATVSYLEAHGTATAVGDPIEISALAEVFRPSGMGPGSCAVGSVKANVGHLIQAAGVAGLIKTALMLRHRTIVPSVNFNEPNPLIDFAATPFFVNTDLRDWENGATPRRAGVSAFGFGGTNAHVVLEEAPARTPMIEEEAGPHLLPLSAKSPEALRELVDSYGDRLASGNGSLLRDVCHSAQIGRRHFPHRLAVIASSSDEMRATLSRAELQDPKPKPVIGFLFAGQGAHYGGMGRRLDEIEPVFRAAIDECAADLDFSLRDVLFGDDSPALLTRTEYAQPALVAMEIALVRMWREWGIDADVVLGHSLGELSAAWAAGMYSLQDMVRFAAIRGRLMQRASPGLMAAVFAPSSALPADSCIAVAAINGPEQTVISGESGAVEAVLSQLEARQIASRRLSGTAAFHSPLMDPILDELDRAARSMTLLAQRTRFISTLTGGNGDGVIATPSYWRRQARETVRFGAAVAAMDCDVVLEIGPDSSFGTMGRNQPSGKDRLWLSSLKKASDDRESILAALGALYERGADVNWRATVGRGSRVALPKYPFQRRRFWIEERREQPRKDPNAHPLLGTRIPSPLSELLFQSELTADVAPFARDHWVYGARPLVLMGQIEMMRAAAAEGAAGSSGSAAVENVVVEQPLLLTDERRRIQTILTLDGDVRIFSADDANSWTLHSSARVHRIPTAHGRIDLDAIRARCSETVAGEDIYARKRARGADIGGSMEVVIRAWRRSGEVLAEAVLDDAQAAIAEGYGAYPGLLDSVAQCADLTLPDNVRDHATHLFLPTVADRVTFHDRLPRRICIVLRLHGTPSPELYSIDGEIVDESGRVLVEIEGLHFKRATPAALRRSEASSQEQLYDIAWVALEKNVSLSDWNGRWLILDDGSELANLLARRIDLAGGRCVVAGTDFTFAGAGSWRGIIHLRGLGMPGSDPLEVARQTCGSAMRVVQEILTADVGAPLWLITRGAQATGHETAPLQPMQSALWGFGRVIQREQPTIPCRLIDLDPAAEDDLENLLGAIAHPEHEITIRASIFYGNRVRPGHPGSHAAGAYAIQPSRERTIEGLAVVPMARRAPGPGEVEIEVYASGLNFRDVLNVTGRIDGPLGYECSGVIARVGDGVANFEPGAAVMALAPNSFASHVVVDARLVVPKPRNLSFSAAAGAVVAYATAMHALVERGGLKPGQRVLIHTAAGGVGQAAVQVARLHGAEVIATASRSKWASVRALGVEQVFDSRVPGFSREVGKVDMVLNTLGGEFTDDNLAVLRPGGKWLELGHPQILDLARTAQLAAAAKVEFINFHIATDVAAVEPDHMQQMLTTLAAWLNDGRLRALPCRIFPLAEVRKAFETMLRGAHVGKLVVAHPAADRAVNFAADPDGTYLISGGTGAVGLRIAEWLCENGARHLALLARRPPSGPAQDAIRTIQQSGVVVRVIQSDVADHESLHVALEEVAREMPRLRGIVHAAGVTDDGVVSQLTWPRFAAVLAPKVAGAWNLHRLTEDQPLDFFILISSLAGVWGNPGQASYAAANAFLDQLAHFRRQRGLTALSIDYGVWRGAGLGAALSEDARRRRSQNGLGDLDPDLAVRALGSALITDRTQVGAFAIEWEKYLVQFKDSVPERFAELARPIRPAVTPKRGETETGLPPCNLDDAIERTRRHVAALSGGGRDLDVQRPLAELGLDSLGVLVLRGRMIAEFGEAAALPVIRFLEGHSLAKLASMMMERAQRSSTARQWKSLTLLKGAGERPPLFLVPAAARTALVYSTFAEAFESDHPVYGLNPVGLDGDIPPHQSIEEAAAHYVAEIRSLRPQGPYLIGGTCFGGYVAWEMALQLTEGGFDVPLVVLFDPTPPVAQRFERSPGAVAGHATRYYYRRIGHAIRHYYRRIPHHLRHRSLHRAVAGQFHKFVTGQSPLAQDGLEKTVGENLRRVIDAQARASLRYRARSLQTSVLLLQSNEFHELLFEEAFRLIVKGSVESVVFPETSHLQVLQPDHSPALARVVSERLRTLSL